MKNFFVLATMNPGGDYGKKELSPALRNRFTEIWVPPVCDLDELGDIASKRLSNPELSYIVGAMLKFWEWFNKLEKGRILTVRDLLSWIQFIMVTTEGLGPDCAFLHGLFLVLLDGISLGTGISSKDAGLFRETCLSFLLKELKEDSNLHELSFIGNYGWGDLGETGNISCSDDMQCDNSFGIDPFYIEKGYEKCEAGGFEFLTPTTRRNALRVLRAMQLPKPVLLEGSPGVGKTSLIMALGKYSGHKVVRINLSEQTDLMDLLGTDLPVESDEGMKFAWSDGILLQALKEGCWVLLDELNLAPQSVLEGLNAILDHRAEVFIPELSLTFKCPSSFRIFACQNPFSQGGGRKGLPKSFLNRFTKVYIDELVEGDYLSICNSIYPSIPRPLLSKLIVFNKRLHEDTMLYHKFGQDGSPWEFNLRDVIRSCQIIEGVPEKLKADCFLNILYVQRMRTAADRKEVLRIYEEVFGVKPFINPYPRVQLNSKYLIVGNTVIKRNTSRSSKLSNSALNVIPSIRHNLEAVVHCLKNQWLCILVGPPCSGKTSLIRLLAHLTGNVLNELSLSTTTDISELLGCFEQYNAFRNFRSVIAQVERYFSEYCNLQLEFSKVAFMNERSDLITKWLAFLSTMNSSSMTSSSSIHLENWESMMNSLSLLVEIIQQMKMDVVANELPFSWSTEELNKTIKVISKLQDDQQRRSRSVKFEWVAGLLIKAIENGEWIVLENANLCNPTVLDRINSLVEPSGSITVNECGIVDGSSVVLHPHHNFRIFLTVNPSHGEVSRAMRNRGVEIFMMPPYWLYNDESGCSGADFELKDVKRFLVSSGIHMNRLVDSMSKAHVYAKNEGLHVNVQITYLELAHWVQLFHQLLINGNQPFWSLELSWEHTYLSSLGEAVGWDIVNHAKAAYFSTITLSESDLPTELSFYMPVGLPVPKKLRDFIWYSKETSVRQNLMYLEYLVAQYELGSSRNMSCVDNALSATSHMGGTGWMDMKMMGQLMFPKALNCMNANSVRNTKIDMKLAKRMLVFTANWTIEQATGKDYKLYLLHFRWLSSKLQSCDHFFRSFLHLLEQELEHPIWKCIFHSYHELASHPDADPSLHLTPLLSLDFVDLSMSYDRPEVSYKFLCNAINCIELLRLSYLQWNAQSEHEYTNEAQHFKPILGALQELEREILNMLVESPSYDILIKLYSDMLEDHLTFWDVLTSSRFEQLPVSWHSLMKDILKLRDFCPVAVDNLFMIAGNIDKKLLQHTQQSLLWIHGGHPILPATAELFKQQQLFIELCESVWPTTVNPYNQGDDCLVEVAASSTPELRFLAVQGICMSAYITSRFDEDSSEVVLHLADMSQMLLKRFEYEKSKLEAKLNSIESGTIEGNSIFCCDFSPEARCTKPGFASWLETRPIIDNTSFFLDMDLLQRLSMIVLVDRKECQLAVRSVSNLLESAMKHSLTFSTRPPQNFIPHQKILWTLDAWMSVDAVNAKIASYVLEMWFWWHSSLWNHCPAFSENFGKVDGYHTPLPNMLVQPVRTASVVHSLRRTCAIKDYSVHCLKLKAASCNLWQSSLPRMDLSCFLLSVTRSLFQQIIYAHRKAFDADKFAAIESIFCSLHKNVATQDDIQCLVSILGSSNHQKLNSLVSLFIEPILKELYLHCSSTEVYLNMGHACLKIGALRFSLLLSCDDSDPAMKYSFKHSQLEERISSLELEIKVRQECDYLAGQLSSIEADKKRADALERLEIERRRIQKKMVFRCNPLKFNALRKECGEFLKPARKVVGLVDNIEGMDLQQVLEQASNWQATATSFIDRLSDEYKEYIDLAQPFQVAVYEMKLGLSLVLSFTLLKKVLNTIKEDNMDRVMESIYSFMRFPRVHAFISSSHSIGSPANFWDREMGILEKLIMLSSDVTTEKMGSILQLKTGLYQNIVVRVAHFVADAQRIDDASFKILDKMFHEFANMWMNMKVQVKCKEGDDAQQYKFRPRALEIKSIVDVDFSTLDQFFPKDSFSEWQEFLSEEESLEKLEASNEHENVQDEWNLMQETIMKNMICIHNQLFGSTNLVLYAGTFHVDDADRLHSFTNSYTLGAGMIEGLGGLLTSSLDGKLIPEHLLRLCLEHGSKLVSSQKSSANYNFYKDSNAPMMAKMVKLVANLQLKICSLLSEWEDHPGLQKIMDTIQMLLAIPVETPLAKVLLGLQFLLNRARALQENESKFPLSDQLEPISALVCSWQKMEFDSWPALLQEVQEQYDINAGKLWFPLFSVLHHSHSADIAKYEESTIESLEDFIRTSSIGEFRARLQLLFALHGQITAGKCLEVQNYLSPRQEKNLQVLYNVFGYYIQFLPRILEDIEANRKGIEMELKEILKLFHWERTEICLSVENSKRTRQKLRKLILKYTDLLQQPVMLILDRETQQKGPKIHSLQFPRALKDNKHTISDLTQFCEKDRSIWLADWRKKVTDTLQNLHFKNTSGLSFLDNKDVTSITRQSLASHSSHLSCDEQWNVLCWTAEKIFKTAMDCDDLWSDTGKGVGKKRALSELLKLLETSGLHKHKFEIMKISNSSNWLFVQPSYNAQHLLLTPSRLSGEALDVSTSSELQCLPDDYVDTIWKSANEFYFKSVASVQLMQRICLKPHGDITYDQASRAVSFLNHLIVIQQSQRAAAYDFSKQLKCLRECTYAFGNSYLKCTDIDERTSSEYSIVQNQRAIFQCMWKQKQLFDGLTTLLAEESLLLRTVESTHLKSCQSVRPAANHVLQFIEKFIPVTQKSKESLDNYLLGQLGGLQSLLQESLDKSLLGRDVTISAGPSRPYIISKQMEQLVYKNFQVIKEFEEHFFDFRKQDWNRSFIIETLLGHFDDVFKEGKMLADQFESAVKQRSQTRDSSEEVGYNSGNNNQLEADFDSALKKAHNLVMEALEKQISPGDGGFLSEESLENISSWEYLFKSSVQGLNVEELCDILLNIIICAKKLVDQSGSETCHISFHIGRCFQHLHILLELILGFCDGLLQDLLAMHKTVSIMTCELANVLASLFSKGFGISVKDEVDEASHDTSQTASGTGMGEGSGLNDVSDQITDEDQLLGTSEKASR
uniref:AAA+ ATPase domain-containing protein n=1 Tax=Salix viminalis TaxID=40686 RepID=A0A6N2MX25_SALVM